MLLLVLVFFALVFPRTINAQEIPLIYQLLMAFRPTTAQIITQSIQPSNLASSTSALTSQILGVSTTTPPITQTEIPAIGGDDIRTITIAVLGDSMIDTLGNLSSLQKTLTAKYPGIKYKILNYGYGASTIEQALNRLSHDYNYNGIHHDSLIAINPDIVVVESFAYNNFGNTQSGFDRQWNALASITGTLKQKLPKTQIVIATTIAPDSITFGNGAPNVYFSALEKIEKTSTIKLYLENAINFANSEKYPLADTYHPSLSGNNGNINLINSQDHIHPSASGAQLFGNILAKTIINSKLLE